MSVDALPQNRQRYLVLATRLVGFYFVACAFAKATEGLFGIGHAPLDAIFQDWIQRGLPVGFYKSLMEWGMPYTDWIAGIVVVIQGIGGLLLLLNIKHRIAGALLFFVQLNIYLAIFYQPSLRVLVGLSLWISLYYITRDELHGWLWQAMTWALVALGLLWALDRWPYDSWVSAYVWQQQYFAEYVMSSHVFIKQQFLSLSTLPGAAYLWMLAWWIKFVLTVWMITPERRIAAASLLVLCMLQGIVWLSVWGVEGTLWSLTLFVWIAHDLWTEAVTAKNNTVLSGHP